MDFTNVEEFLVCLKMSYAPKWTSVMGKNMMNHGIFMDFLRGTLRSRSLLEEPASNIF